MSQAKARSGGVLPIAAAATRKANGVQKSVQRAPVPRLRLIVRRLPPGLTELEFWENLGVDWQVGKGKVDFFAFKPGKISKDPSKPSRPGRAYLKVKDQSLLDVLSILIKQAQFKDARNTSSDPCLVGPPSLEFAPYNKSPGGRARNDGRQGTIDQDQEFIDFLQSLTEPIARPALNGDAGEVKHDKVNTTPLVRYIKEKKANKAKDKQAAAAKAAKKEDVKDTKKADSKPTVVVKGNSSAAEKARVAKATQDAVKAINKSVASMQTKAPAKQELKSKEPAAVQPPAPKRERERGNASVAARMISRDLGLTPKEPRAQRTPKPNAAETSNPAPAPPAPVQSANSPKPTNTTTSPPTGPRNAKSPAQAQPKARPTPARQTKNPPQPTAGSKSAFLKHANPSQGITEELLRSAFTIFGELTRCEIDKKKGLGYIDFTDADALIKAMAASPVKVGNGQVVVLENRSPYKKGVAAQRVEGPGTNVKSSNASTITDNATSPQITGPITTTSSATLPLVLPSPITNVLTPETPTAATPNAGESPSSTPIIPSTSASTAPASIARGARAGGNTGRGSRGGSNPSANRGGSINRGARANFRGGRGGRGSKGNTASGSTNNGTAGTISDNTAAVLKQEAGS